MEINNLRENFFHQCNDLLFSFFSHSCCLHRCSFRTKCTLDFSQKRSRVWIQRLCQQATNLVVGQPKNYGFSWQKNGVLHPPKQSSLVAVPVLLSASMQKHIISQNALQQICSRAAPDLGSYDAGVSTGSFCASGGSTVSHHCNSSCFSTPGHCPSHSTFMCTTAFHSCILLHCHCCFPAIAEEKKATGAGE